MVETIDSQFDHFTNMMLASLLMGISGICIDHQSIGQEVIFKKFEIKSGESLCFKSIPPYTSIVFKKLPPSKFMANYTGGNVESSRTGPAGAVGFDSANSTVDLEVIPSESGRVSYFAVTFASDCSERILSTHSRDKIKRDSSSGKVCYFNGANRKLGYEILSSVGKDGTVESKGLDLKLKGDSVQRLDRSEASVITWENVKSIGIHVHGHGNAVGLFQSLSGNEPSFLVKQKSNWGGRRVGKERPLFRHFAKSRIHFSESDLNFRWSWSLNHSLLKMLLNNGAHIIGWLLSTVALVGITFWITRKYFPGKNPEHVPQPDEQ
jgi:hypothetical protein